ncbi:hypothetical protein V7146_16240 [Gottfriedia acidiceleris]|uniref:McrC family protein n=1 Tax=Gottfriedia acidiceleris TaxID=371036 RepID=UPI002FFE7A15
MKHIVLTECYEFIRIAEDDREKTISPSQADELAIFIKSQKLKKEYISWGNKSITFFNYVGYIQCSTFSIEILPKVTLHNDFNHMRKVLIGMLNECGYLNVTTSNMARLQLVDGSLLEIFGRIYATNLFKELNKGITTKYQQVENNLMTLKGALIIAKHINNNLSRNKKYMAYCEYEERTIDHDLNQVFKAANNLLLRSIINLETQKLLRQIEHEIDGVTLKIFSKKQLSNINLDRTNKRYELALILAKQFLTNVTGSFSAKNEASFSLLFEMNDLFEKYIATLMRKRTNHTVHLQHNKYRLLVKENTNRDIFQLKPDIVVENESVQVIIDTKWKSLTDGNRSGIKREDLFQMYAYLTRYDNAQTAILLYPLQLDLDYKKQIESIESWYLHANEEKKLKVYAVSLESRDKTIDVLDNILRLNSLLDK